MARAGLGPGWTCALANDFDHKKAETYRLNWGPERLIVGDVRTLDASLISQRADLAWASFPCQDLSLAGAGAGLKGERSGTFWPFWNIIRTLCVSGKAPRAIILENVVGTITSHKGKDFAALCEAVASQGYTFGAIVVDAALFLPHSRPRLFIVAFKDDVAINEDNFSDNPCEIWHTKALVSAHSELSDWVKSHWRWWKLPSPKASSLQLADIVEENPDVRWHSPDETKALLAKMSKVNKAKLGKARKTGVYTIGAGYRRTRYDDAGNKLQRIEVRFDGLAGCLRTPAGGSSRQLIFETRAGVVRSRLISARETARLMGLSDEYELPTNYNEAYHLTGDGVAVPVVRHIVLNLIEPIISNQLTLRPSAVA